LGFTKSKVDSNLYFKVMNDEPVILLLYVDDLFLTREEKLITDCKKKLATEFDESPRPDALLLRSSSLAEPREDLP